jgi:O-antigen ligase
VFNKKINVKKQYNLLIPILLPVTYIATGIIKHQSPSSLLLGGFGRNIGLSTLIALSLLFIYFSIFAVNTNYILVFSFFTTLVFANVYGYLQYFNLDPITWSNPYKAVSLTLGNPNFAGALFGCLTVLTLYFLFTSKNSINRLLFSLLGISSIFLSFKTNSLQSVLLIFLSFFVFFLVISLNNSNKKFKLVRNVLIASLVFFTGFLSIGLNYISDFKERIFSEGSIAPRLDYWRTGIEIWKSNPIFGVGADQYQYFSALYRTPEQVVRDGNFLFPDKSHNVLIDHLANGGASAGILWILLIYLVFKASYYLIYHSEINKFQLATLISIWTCYVTQSLISPDQIILAVIGYTSGGLLVGLYNKNRVTNMTSQNSSYALKDKTRFSLVFIILFLSIFYVKALSANYKAQEIVTGKLLGNDIYFQVINSWENAKFTEELAIASLRTPNNCDFSNKLADRLIDINGRSAQGWFIKSFCANSRKDFNLAIKFVNKSLEFDPSNPYYLVSKAKLQISANQIRTAEETLSQARKINPNEPDLIEVSKTLDFLKTQNN